MNQRNRLDEHFSEAARLLDTVRNDAAFMDAVEAAGAAMCQAIAQGGKIISCGNGGSMSDAIHFAEEL
ncbi:MAG: SIS domain-containing protein, partial [Flavobacteriales bacterium]